MDLTTATPVQIDTEMARLYAEAQRAEGVIESLTDSLHHHAGDRGERVGRGPRRYKLTTEEAEEKTREIAADDIYQAEAAVRVIMRLDGARKALANAEAASDPLHAEFLSRGGWTRAFLVTSSDGHVHRSMTCSTCNLRTGYAWMVDYSGKDETEIVEAAGERACTVCYPSAPVDVLARPTRMFTPDEVEAQAVRVERAAAKAKRDADKLAKALLPDGSELRIKINGFVERMTSEVSARNWLVGHITDHETHGYRLDETAAETVLGHLAAKHGVDIDQERKVIAEKVAAKIKRESR